MTHPQPPSRRQADVLDIIIRTFRVTDEPVPSTFIARRLGISPVAVRRHLESLHRKGWLETDGAPAKPRPSYLTAR